MARDWDLIVFFTLINDQVSGEDGDGGGEGGEEEGAAVWPDQAQHPEEEEDFQGGGDECEAQEDEDWEVDG